MISPYYRQLSHSNDREKWLADRAEHITASDAAALLGEGTYKTYAQLLSEKVTGKEGFQGKPFTRIGTCLEDGLLAHAYEEFDRWTVLRAYGRLIESREFPLLAATPDAIGICHDGTLENIQIKLTAKYAKTLARDGLPPDWYYQVQVEMLCLGPMYQRSQLLVMHRRDFPGDSLADHYVRLYAVERDEEVIGRIKEEAKDFWARVERSKRLNGPREAD